MKNKIIVGTILILSLVKQILNDLPIHCLNSQVAGVWHLELTKPKQLSSGLQNNCGHMMPDHERSSYLALKNTFQSMVYSQFYLQLYTNGQVDNQQQFQARNNGKRILDFITSKDKFRFKNQNSFLFRQQVYDFEEVQNNWSMIYDEGFEIRIEKVKILLFNQYFRQGSKWKSNCSSTITGWYHNTQTDEYGCVRGEMVGGAASINDQQEQLWVVQNKVEKRTSPNRFRMYRFKSKVQNTNNKNNSNKKVQNKYQAKLRLNNRFTAHFKVVDKLNSIEGMTWTAGVSKFVEQKTIAQLNRMTGRMKKNKMVSSVQTTPSTPPKNISKEYTEEDLSMFPLELDWSQKIGYMPKTRSQEDCGSCYAISTVSMLDFRLKIKYPQQDIESLSVQQVIDCNFYNQGCDGGYPSLVGRFGQEMLLIEERFKTYQGRDTQCGLVDQPLETVKQVVTIGDYGYVGGRYGNGNTSNIMREIMEHGPVVLSFEPDYFFSLYTRGVYKKVEVAEWVASGLARPEWIKIDHSVLCYGWGETPEGVKYWLLQNSWGQQWGDNGNFKMLRGKDEMGIESSAEFAYPILSTLQPSHIATLKAMQTL